MPAYDYDCAACGRRFEVVHGVHADGPTTCPLCGKGPVRKAISAPAIHYKGSGWAKKERRATATPGGRREVVRPRRGSSDEAGSKTRRRTSEEASGSRRRPASGSTGDLDEGVRGRDRQHQGLTEMAAPTDWITLGEAAEILAAANVHFTPGRSAAGRGPVVSRASSSAAAGSSGGARSGRSWRPLDASGPRTSSRSCSRTSAS